MIVAGSLTQFFVERQWDRRKAQHWLGVARRLQPRFKDKIIKKDLQELAKETQQKR